MAFSDNIILDKEMLESILACIPGSIYWKNKDGIYLGCNDEMSRFLGLAKNNIIGKTDHQIIKELGWDKKIADNLRKIDLEVIENKKPRLNVEEIPFVDIDGKIIFQLTNKVPWLNHDGEVIGVVGNSIDIVTYKQMEEDLRQAKIKAEVDYHHSINIIENHPEYIYWKDKNLVYQGCNKHVAEYLGLSSVAEIIGKTDHDFGWSQERVNELIKIDTEILNSGMSYVTEDVIPDSNQFSKIMLTSKTPLRDVMGNIIGILGISIDISNQKKLENILRQAKEVAETANQAKTEFITNISHDIKTPLNGIIGMAKILEQHVQDSQEKIWAKNVSQCGEKLLNLLNNVLDKTSLDHFHDDVLNKNTFDLQQTICELVKLESPSASLKNLLLTLKMDSTIPKLVISDPIKLNRILLNLIGNAIKFTEHGSIDIRVKVVSSDHENVNVEFSVSDTGVGIPEHLQEKIFKRFFKIAENIHTGHGVGLSVALKYVKLLGGKLQLKSAVGQGTTFYFVLPMKIGVATDRNTVSKKAITTLLSVPTILLIEDDPVTMEFSKYVLAQLGCNIKLAADGISGLMMAKTEPYDLILTDVNLPGISGEELTLLIRNWEKKLNKHPAPIIGLTAYSNVNNKFSDSGMNEIIHKPIDINVMSATLNKFVTSTRDASDSPHNKKFNTSSENLLKMLMGAITEESINLQDAYNSHNLQLMTDIAHKLMGRISMIPAVIKETASDHN